MDRNRMLFCGCIVTLLIVTYLAGAGVLGLAGEWILSVLLFACCLVPLLGGRRSADRAQWTAGPDHRRPGGQGAGVPVNRG